MKSDKNILVAFLLNFCFSILELIGGVFTGSMAILSDAFHDMGDAFSIFVSYILEKISMKKPNQKYTYGYVRYSVMGSVVTTTILLVGSIFIILESIKRILHPVDVHYDGVIILAIFGVLINSFAAYFTSKGESLNQKAVNLHMLDDVLGWVVVLAGSIVMKFTNITMIDSFLSIFVALFISYHAFRNVGSIADIFLAKTPKDIQLDHIKKHLLKIDGVLDVHHIHVQSMDGFHNYATLHVVVKKYQKKIKESIREELMDHNIAHSTIEFELKDEDCEQEKCKIPTDVHHHYHHH